MEGVLIIFGLIGVPMFIWIFLFLYRAEKIIPFRHQLLKEESDWFDMNIGKLKRIRLDPQVSCFRRQDSLPSSDNMALRFWIPLKRYKQPLEFFYPEIPFQADYIGPVRCDLATKISYTKAANAAPGSLFPNNTYPVGYECDRCFHWFMVLVKKEIRKAEGTILCPKCGGRQIHLVEKTSSTS